MVQLLSLDRLIAFYGSRFGPDGFYIRQFCLSHYFYFCFFLLLSEWMILGEIFNILVRLLINKFTVKLST